MACPTNQPPRIQLVHAVVILGVIINMRARLHHV